MRLRARRRALSTPWWIVALLLAVAVVTTALSLRVVMDQEDADHQTLGTAAASSVAQDLTRVLSRFYTPTVAAGGFVAGVLEQAGNTGTRPRAALDTTWAPFATPLVRDLGDALLDFQLAPEAIVTYSARPEENAAALGHNLLVDDARRAQIIEAIAARGPIVAGPLDLLQGGKGLIIRQAVFLPGLDPFAERFAEATGDDTDYPWMSQIPDDFWGMTTTVVDFDLLTQSIGQTEGDGLSIGVFTVADDGSVGEPIWGSLTAASAFTSEQELTLVDGSRWLVRVEVPTTPWMHFWPLLLIGLGMTIVFLVLARLAYRAQQRNRIGFTFSESISHLTTRRAVLERTSSFLTELYPGIRGRIISPEPHPETVPIPLHTMTAGEWGDEGSELQWRIVQSGEIQCVIDVEAGGPFHARELDEVIGLVRRILGASLSALNREGQLERRAAVDFLTEAYNRTQLVPVFERLRDDVARSEQWLMVACLDVDDFKGVNDSMGHLFGDEVLKTLTGTLQGSLRSGDAVVRFGGDEFVVMAAVRDPSQARDLCQRLQGQTTHALTLLADGQRSITVSLGFTVAPGREPASMERLLERADSALYAAKKAGGAHVQEDDRETRGTRDSIR